MKKHFCVLAACALVIIWSSFSAAQTADEVIEKHLAAAGGREAMAKLTSRVMTGTVTVTSPVGNLSGTVELSNKPPNKARTLVKLDGTAFGIPEIVNDQRFDGTTAYVSELTGAREITGDQLEVAK